MLGPRYSGGFSLVGGDWGLLSSCGAQASHCRGFSFCGAWAQYLLRPGLVAPRHVGSSWTRDQTCVPCIGRLILLHCATRKVPCCCYCSVTLVMSNSLQPHRHSLPGSSVHGIFPARILEWVAMPSSKASFQPRYRTCVCCIAV